MSYPMHLGSGFSRSRLTGPLLIGMCVAALLLAASVLKVSPSLLPQQTNSPQPTSPELIAALRRMDAKGWIDSHGRVWKVDLAHRRISDDDLAVLSQLLHLEWLNLRAVNRSGGEISNEGLRHLSQLLKLRHLDLSANSDLTDAALIHLKELTHLETLNLWRTGVGNEGLAALNLREMNRLESLNISGTRVTNEGLVYLKDSPQLKQLDLPSRGVTQEGLIYLQDSSIEHLGGVSLREDGFPLLSGLTKLRRLPRYCDPKDTDLIHLRNLTQLEELRVDLSEGWSNSYRLRYMQTMIGLKTVEISGRVPSDQDPDWSGLAVLGNLPNLERFRLVDIPDEALVHLPKLNSLRVLDLASSRVSGNGLRYLMDFPRLETLTLNRFEVTNEGLASLRHLRQLRELLLEGRPLDRAQMAPHEPRRFPDDWAYVQLTDAGLKHLAHMPQLEVLKLKGLPITDAGLHHLRHLIELKELELDSTNITDAGLVHLRGLSNLEKLRFVHTPVTRPAAANLHAVIPHCWIADNNWCCGCMEFPPRTRQ